LPHRHDAGKIVSVTGLDETLTDDEDRAYVASIADAEQRATIVASLLRHRVAETLRAGDPLPDVTLTALDPERPVALRDLVNGRPVVLVFGSYT
jgi:hypothetical protein